MKLNYFKINYEQFLYNLYDIFLIYNQVLFRCWFGMETQIA